MTATDRRAARWPPILMLIVAWFTGCGRTDSPNAGPDVPHDSVVARQALTDVLEAWKRGEVAKLAHRSPPIRFADEDQASGLKLVDYSIDQESHMFGQRENVRVSLTMRNTHGQTNQKHATYQVTTSPMLAVLRSDQ